MLVYQPGGLRRNSGALRMRQTHRGRCCADRRNENGDFGIFEFRRQMRL